MERSRFSDEQIIAIVKENEAGAGVDELFRRHGIGMATCLSLAEEGRRDGSVGREEAP